MTKIGAAWWKFTDKNEQYLSLKIDEELLPFAIREQNIITLWEIPQERRKSENSPHYDILLTKSTQNKKPKENTG